MPSRFTPFLYLIMVVSGFLIEAFISQTHFFLTKKHYKKYHYSFARYLLLLSIPLLSTIFIFNQVGVTILNVFLIFAGVGTALEWLVGFSFHMVMGQRLWTYYKYNINTYTSLLSIPLWGIAGVFFYLLVKYF